MRTKFEFHMHKFRTFFLVLLLSGMSLLTMAQDPGTPPDPGACPESGPPVQPGGALGSPIEDAIPFVLAMAFLYGAYQFTRIKLGVKEEKSIE